MKKIWKAFKKGWMKFAHVVGKVNTTILLSILYFVIVGIYSIITHLFKLFALPFKKTPETYWITRKDKFDPDSLKHPF
jgi:hypothetical protein